MNLFPWNVYRGTCQVGECILSVAYSTFTEKAALSVPYFAAAAGVVSRACVIRSTYVVFVGVLPGSLFEKVPDCSQRRRGREFSFNAIIYFTVNL